jgi:hypothetical protein
MRSFRERAHSTVETLAAAVVCTVCAVCAAHAIESSLSVYIYLLCVSVV